MLSTDAQIMMLDAIELWLRDHHLTIIERDDEICFIDFYKQFPEVRLKFYCDLVDNDGLKFQLDCEIKPEEQIPFYTHIKTPSPQLSLTDPAFFVEFQKYIESRVQPIISHYGY